MKPGEYLSKYKEIEQFGSLKTWLSDSLNPDHNSLPPNKSDTRILHLTGLSGSSPALLAATAIKESKETVVLVLPDKDMAAYFRNDLLNFLGNPDNSGIPDKNAKKSSSLEILFFPSSYKRSVQYYQKSKDHIVRRTEVQKKINQDENPKVIVTFPEALVEKMVSRKFLNDNAFRIRKGEKLSMSFLSEFLEDCQFQQVDFVYEPGQFSLRGSIIDVFSYSARLPFRIDFFGDEIDSIRSFDIENQLSVEKLEKVSLIPNLVDIQTEGESQQAMVPFTEFLGENVVYWTYDLAYSKDRMDEIYKLTRGAKEEDGDHITDNNKQDFLIDGNTFTDLLSSKRIIEFGQQVFFTPQEKISFNTLPQPAFNKNFELLAKDMIQRETEGYTCYILSDNQKQIHRLNAIFEDTHIEVRYQPMLTTLHEGFIDHDLKTCLYTDHQIFDRYHRYRLQEQFTRREGLTIRELTGLNPGDYVVHIDHGIGQFGGLEKINLDNREQEAIKLVFRDQDTLFVNIHSLHRISKYKGKDNDPPRIYKLGSGAWQKLKTNTKKKVKDIARELIALYAKRKTQKGFSYSPDSYLQTELEASFMYEDTEDQFKATREMKEGMEAEFPMDRLVCGDVGFGKTEVAVRGAFKAVSDSKQVAILVPTTILALQHFKTFSERLSEFPCKVDYVSRLKNPAAQRKALQELAEGKTDIIIGTHRLVSKDVKFKDLGLLIIDEEQKFGVAIKEKLRQMKLNVDTLTLTATPIPRTLQLSLMGARDLSIIRTPPPNRYPIMTELHSFNEDLIREAVYYEVNRGGQVFFIHNRIQNIAEIEALVIRICPDVKTIVAHGQMQGPKLEKIMLGFIEGEYDVLISTTIIESGLDIPNANTIIINQAHHFGLSDLHQLRGRVGRSNRKAFCYLLAPPLTLQTPEARRRLKAIEEFSEIGSGLNIAMQDLDIRGAGNLLGGEQSGFIAEIGFETYHRILDEALLELKEGEYKELFRDQAKPEDREDTTKYVTDCQIDTDLTLLFPDNYIGNNAERLRLYRVLDSIKLEDRLQSFEQELEDRFGPIPPETKELINVVRLRWLSIQLGFEKIILKKSKMIIHFVSNPDSSYYVSPTFRCVLNFVQSQGRQFNLKELNGKLRLSTESITSISKAMDVLNEILSTPS
jgi:transcription-repair coupling factor (superfamily II helicase)